MASQISLKDSCNNLRSIPLNSTPSVLSSGAAFLHSFPTFPQETEIVAVPLASLGLICQLEDHRSIICRRCYLCTPNALSLFHTFPLLVSLKSPHPARTLSTRPPVDDGSPPSRAGLLESDGSPPQWTPQQTKHSSTHTVPHLLLVTCLLLVTKGSWLHADMHRCSWCEAHDASKQNPQCTASIHQFSGCPYC